MEKENIIIYSEDDQLWSSLQSGERLSDLRSYRLIHVKDYNQFGHVLTPDFKGLLFYSMTHDSDIERVRLRYIINLYHGLSICLCSRPDMAYYAWRMNVFHFVALDDFVGSVQSIYHKYIRTNSSLSLEHYICRAGGTLKNIALEDILFLKADGNYTRLHTKHHGVIMEARQIGQYSELYEGSDSIIRVNRSYIMNLRNIKKIDEAGIHFYDYEGIEEVSSRFKAKIGKLLLGKI